MKTPSPLVLASASPRRAALLRQLGLPFDVVATSAEETARADGLSPGELACWNARMKAAAVECDPERCIIAADTIVVLDEQILGKPAEAAHAATMLRQLSGQTHSVITGLFVGSHHNWLIDYVETRVTFSELSEDLIAAYVATGEPLDKAGAYGIQERGAVLIDRIEGDYFNVVGLPLARLAALLRELGVTVSDFW